VAEKQVGVNLQDKQPMKLGGLVGNR